MLGDVAPLLVVGRELVNMWPCAAVYSPYTVPDRVCVGGLAVYSPDTVPRVCRGLRSNICTCMYHVSPALTLASWSWTLAPRESLLRSKPYGLRTKSLRLQSSDESTRRDLKTQSTIKRSDGVVSDQQVGSNGYNVQTHTSLVTQLTVFFLRFASNFNLYAPRSTPHSFFFLFNTRLIRISRSVHFLL